MRFLILILFSGVVASVAHSQPQCDTNASFNCGELRNVKYPFWEEGRNQANCNNKDYMLSNCVTGEFPNINIGGESFLVKNISQENYTMNLSLPSEILPSEPCAFKDSLQNVTRNQILQPRLKANSTIYVLYGCHFIEELVANSHSRKWDFGCGANGWVYWDIVMYQNHLYKSLCKFHIEVPVIEYSIYLLNSSTNSWEFWVHLQKAFNDGFAVSFALPQRSTTIKGLDKPGKIIIAFSVCGATILIMGAFFFIYQRYKKTKYASSSNFTRNISSAPSSTNDPEKMGALYGVKFFTYDELEEATDSFDYRREIGDGGFGTVYLGKLKDGRTVAVKRLYENNFKRVEQFLNEVEILTHLRHRNLVMLYGCTSRHSRELLLVYEYVSNGTVADHVHGQNEKPGSLPWETRLKIAVETASALKYLHASGTIHRDVKTNNILLDDNFGVKVADFGLSRLFPLDVTHVSTAPQGTPGYVDPEYHQCYQLTDKSDVYSFGVVLVELISSKPAVDITRHRHEINLSNMAINKIQNGMLHELVDPSLGFDKDCNVHKSITAVAELAFQCLQSDKDLRPTMQEVLEILTRIQCGDSFVDNKAEELDVFSDEFVLLKSGPLPHSPESVTDKSVSR